MKNMLFGFFVMAIVSCNDGAREGGTINDGIKPVDSNGALNDGHPLTDSTNNPIENKTRTDIQQRDTFTTPGQ